MENYLISNETIKNNIKTNTSIDRFYNLIWFFLVFLSFSFPVNFQPVKIVLLFIMLTIFAFKLMNKKHIKTSSQVFRLFVIWILFALPVAINGLISNNVGAFAFIKVELLYPVLLFLCVFQLKGENVVRVTYKAMLLSAIFISIYTILLLLYKTGFVSFNHFWIIDDTSDAALHNGYTHITNTNLSMLIFIFPCIAILTKKECQKLKIKYLYCVFVVFLSALAMLLSGRRILWIVEIFSFLIFFFRLNVSFAKKIAILFIFCLIVLVTFQIFGKQFGIDLNGLWERFLNAFADFDEYGQENVRIIQMSKLIDGFKKHIFFGAGGGATLDGYYRSLESPWIFEASYHMILFNSGIVFFSIYIFFFAYLSFSIIKYNKAYMFVLPVFFALTLAIISNATNPYFSASFDFLFFIFIPIVFLNNIDFCKKRYNGRFL